jgi:hypothetical protein
LLYVIIKLFQQGQELKNGLMWQVPHDLTNYDEIVIYAYLFVFSQTVLDGLNFIEGS